MVRISELCKPASEILEICTYITLCLFFFTGHHRNPLSPMTGLKSRLWVGMVSQMRDEEDFRYRARPRLCTTLQHRIQGMSEA